MGAAGEDRFLKQTTIPALKTERSSYRHGKCNEGDRVRRLTGQRGPPRVEAVHGQSGGRTAPEHGRRRPRQVPRTGRDHERAGCPGGPLNVGGTTKYDKDRHALVPLRQGTRAYTFFRVSEKACGLSRQEDLVALRASLERQGRTSSTHAPRKVFFPTYTPPEKTISLVFAPAGAKLCEALSTSRLYSNKAI